MSKNSVVAGVKPGRLMCTYVYVIIFAYVNRYMCKTTMPFECYFIDFCPMEDLKHNLQINLEYWQQEESIAKEKSGKVSHVT